MRWLIHRSRLETAGVPLLQKTGMSDHGLLGNLISMRAERRVPRVARLEDNDPA
jgi:hypothetical protein